MKLNFLFILLIVVIVACNKHEKSTSTITNPITIAFGSCAHSYDSLPIFNAISKNKPDVWVWLGDIMYGDSHDMEVLKHKYSLQKAKPEYQALMSSTKIIGIWDDHDYGVNDGGKFYSEKEQSKTLLLDFLEVPTDDPVRNHPGVFSQHNYTFGDKLVKIILLDTRYFRDTLAPDFNRTRRYIPNEEGDILGEEQWQWLEQVLRNSKADFHIVGSGIQVVADEQGYEKWANFPKSRQRLFNLLASIKPKPLMLISGDRHMAEISKINIPGLSYPLYDFTSSGLTHTWGMARDEPNRYRVDSLIISKNFGLIKLNWQKAKPEVTLEIRDERDKLLQRTKIDYQ